MGAFFSPRARAVETFLFSFEKDNQTSYLLGSIHSLDPIRLPIKVRSCASQRSTLILENTDMQKPLDMTTLSAMGVLKRPEDPFFSIDQLEKDDAEELLRYVNPFLLAKGGHVQADQLNLKGLYAAYISGHFLNGVDYWLLKSFQQDQKEIQGLETTEDISHFFEDVTFEDLEQILKHHAGFDSPYERQIEENYLMGVIPTLADLTDEEELRIRNLKWFPKLVQYHAQYSEEMIAAVGLSHLFGNYGLLKMLSDNGFTLKRMNDSGDFISFHL